ncbi:ADP-ribosylglycohydrolase family protein [Nocardia bovistercoris]|uniref:ADP-ribosylglycohydrolase family protein n=1 Tax=Nocardia bovistercoris TaxID=2785916 RepID=A0A931ICV7_9NOCA|nr:ADP-ribosylglycohydrolase family protein [Nocardia bovistercoris]MBH0779084.1 ADP-ribosylglycohydrolase family protein [Nocardia bovistercoris]
MLVELAVGDAYGAGFEYAEPGFVAEHNTLGAYVQHPTHLGVLPGAYTDDTQMTLAVAELLVSDEPWDRDRLAEYFVRAYRRDPRDGYARRFQEFLGTVSTGSELLAGIVPASDKSGAAMRAGPIGLLPTVDEVLRYTHTQARITHDTPDGIAAAQAAALAVHYCHRGLGPVRDLPAWVASHLGPEWARPWRGKVGSKGWMSVRAALTSLSTGTAMSEILRSSVAWTGDVDTVATIALAAGSRCADIDQDLPVTLIENLENGAYGHDYLRDLNARLLDRFS